ncbi:MAG: tetratricopeptide repeat protein [Planctomycetota bacterium]
MTGFVLPGSLTATLEGASMLDGLLQAVPTLVVAGAFGTFMLYLLLGLLALPVTAALDKTLGKEKALLVYAGALLLFTMFVMGGGSGKTPQAGPGREDKVRTPSITLSGDPFARPDLLAGGVPGYGDRRNVFRRTTDTSPLPAPELEAPPWDELPVSLPPTAPGPAPRARHVLRGEKPVIDPEDGSAIATIPDAIFADRVPQPEEVYDVIETAGGKTFVYVLGVNDGSGWVREGEPGFEDAVWRLSAGSEDERAKIEVSMANVGDSKAASKLLAPEDVLKARRGNLFTRRLNPAVETFHRRETVENRFRAALDGAGLKWSTWQSAQDVGALRRAAQKMAEVGKTGQEAGLGWSYAAQLLEVALQEVDRVGDTARRSELLLELLDAYRARHDEAALFRTLAAYVRANPGRPDGWTWTGDLVLTRMGEPEEALRFYDRGIEARATSADAHLGRARALAWLGRQADALAAVGRAGSDAEAQLLRATTQLRLGQLPLAKSTVEALLSREPSMAEAIHLRGCVLYAMGDLTAARSAFEQAATLQGGAAVRAQACYGLGLTCVRLGQGKAAHDAFEACSRALSQGSDPGPMPDEIVSPAFGHAFLAWCRGDDSAFGDRLAEARDEAPRSSYVEFFAGMTSALGHDYASALRSLDNAGERAEGYAELDGWLGRVHMALGEAAAAVQAPESEVAESFDRSLAFLGRAADREEARDKKAFGMRLRQALAATAATHLNRKRRFQDAKDIVNKILSKEELREQPAALCVRGYAWFQLGAYDESAYDECLRDFQLVVDTVKDDPSSPWATWLTYARGRLDDVKRWRSLEEKRVVFEGVSLSKDWEQVEGNDVSIKLDEGTLVFKGPKAKKDGRLEDPTVAASTTSLFSKRSFEEVSFKITIPGEISGKYQNNNVFGAQLTVASRGGRGRSAAAGIGVFNDRGRVAIRVGGGREEQWRDGEVHRLLDDNGKEIAWPSNGPVTIRFVREDHDEGLLVVYLDDERLIEDRIGGLKRAGGDMQLWIGGYSTQAQPYDVTVTDLRVIRQKGDR